MEPTKIVENLYLGNIQMEFITQTMDLINN